MPEFVTKFIPIAIVGISLGSLFGLAGLGYTVIINASQLVNFALGDLAMLGVAVCWFSMTVLGLPLGLAFPLGVAGAGLYAFLVQKSI
jgi:branched-chain amino acid transport system permease protein